MKKPKHAINIFKIIRVLLIGCLAMLIATIIFIAKFQDQYSEQKFLNEMATIPEATGKIRNTFEGGTLADIEVFNKGIVTVMYGLFGLEHIRRIGKFDTVLICPEDRGIGIGFNLGKNSQFKKWFPFEVNSLQELVNHYDEIVAVLDTFPTSPDPSHAVTVKSRSGEKIVCSIYFKK